MKKQIFEQERDELKLDMKKNIGVLSMCNQYTFIDCTDNGEDYNNCQNCGKLIRYTVHLIDNLKNHYFVGTECAKTLSEANINNSYSMIEQIKELKKCSEVKRILQNKHNIWGHDESFYIVGVLGTTAKKIYINPVFDIFTGNRLTFVDNLILELKDKCKNWNNWCMNDVFVYYDNLKTAQ